jgi:hypothetical protein
MVGSEQFLPVLQNFSDERIRNVVHCGCAILLDTDVVFCYIYLMSQPVNISNRLVLDARMTADIDDRSIAGQIEHWARLGRAIEPLLRGDQALALKRAGEARPLSECLRLAASADGRKRVHEYLKTLPFPHYEQVDSSGLLVKIDADGRRTEGRFVNREFKPIKK